MPESSVQEELRLGTLRALRLSAMRLGVPVVLMHRRHAFLRSLEPMVHRVAQHVHEGLRHFVQQRAIEFDLTPLEADFLQRQLVDELKKKGPGQTT